MNRICMRIFGTIILCFVFFFSLQIFAASDSENTPVTSTLEPTSDSSLVTDGTNAKVDILQLSLDILGSGFICACFAYILDRHKEKKLRIISASDSLLAAFNATFSGEFLERDGGDDWKMFVDQYTHFYNLQSSLIQLLKNNKHGKAAIKNLSIENMIEEINKETGDRRAKEDAIRAYVGKQHNELIRKLFSIK